MTDKHLAELRERLAAIEHERWADWQKWMHGSFYKVEKGNAIHQALPQLLIERWERQIVTPYADLSEAEKQSDRDQVDRYWPLIATALAQQDRESRASELKMLKEGADHSQYTATEYDMIITDRLARLTKEDKEGS